MAPYSEAGSQEDVEAYLLHLGGIGAGLYEMLQAEQLVGPMFRKQPCLLSNVPHMAMQTLQVYCRL